MQKNKKGIKLKVKKILETLNKIAPFELAEKWDNVGLLVGSEETEVNKIYISLDISLNIVKKAEPGSLIITHHPLIFSSMKDINFDSYYGSIIKELIKKDITYISLHTNYDKAILNDYFLREILDIKDYVKNEDTPFLITFEKKVSSLKKLKKDISVKFIESNKSYMDSNEVRLVNSKNKINKIGLCVGSGSSLLQTAVKQGVDVLLTGDITHHVAMEALDLGISLIDITHYHSEKHFGKSLMEELFKAKDFENDIDITLLDSGNPFSF